MVNKNSDFNLVTAFVTSTGQLNVYYKTNVFVTSTDVFTSNYHYFSSTSTTWVSHALNFAERITKDLGLNSNSLVIEIASNDGYLLQHFNKLGIPNFGIEPTKSTAETAREKGVKTLEEFFSLELARNLTSQGDYADLIIGNNVYAHVPDINDFTQGMKEVLKPFFGESSSNVGGILTKLTT